MTNFPGFRALGLLTGLTLGVATASATPVQINLSDFGAGATVITFDSIADGEKITSQFSGVVFGAAAPLGTNPGLFGDLYGNESYFAAPGTQVASNAGGPTACCPPISIEFAAPVCRAGFQFVSAAQNYGTRIELWLAGQSLGTLDFITTPLRESFVGVEESAGFDRMTLWRLSQTTSNAFLMNDLRYESAPTPEPATWLLLGGGLIGVGAARRRARERG